MTTPVASTSGAAATAATDPQRKKLQSAAEGFEAVMLRQLLGSARSASLGDGVFDSSASDQFREMADAKTADQLAHKGVFGIADLLIKQYGAKLAPAPATGTGQAAPKLSAPAAAATPAAAQQGEAK